MINKSDYSTRYSARREIPTMFVLPAVLLIALFTAPQSLLSQSNEQNADTTPIEAAPDSKYGGSIMMFDKVKGYAIEVRNDGSVTMEEITQTLSQVDLGKDLEQNQRVKVNLAKQDGKIDSKVEIINNNAFSQPGIPLDVRVSLPVLINKVEPAYPENAKESGVSGEVMLRVSTDDKGETVSVSVIEGNPALTESAISAISQWRYEPAILSADGKPVSTSFGVLINFFPDGTVSSEPGRSFFLKNRPNINLVEKSH